MREKERESQLASCSLLCVWQRTSLWSRFYLLRERKTESEIVSLVGTLSRQFLITHTHYKQSTAYRAQQQRQAVCQCQHSNKELFMLEKMIFYCFGDLHIYLYNCTLFSFSTCQRSAFLSNLLILPSYLNKFNLTLIQSANLHFYTKIHMRQCKFSNEKTQNNLWHVSV